MVYEREVISFQGLMREVHALDEDSGIRLAGIRGGRECLVFVTRFGSKYTIMAYSMKKGSGEPDKRLETVEVGSPAALGKVIRGVVGKRVRAYVY
jgi:hypothetical protein